MSDEAVRDAPAGGGGVNNGTGGFAGSSGGPGVSDGPHQGWVVALVCGVLPAALLAAIVGVPAALWSRLPGRVADHWTAAGTANGTAPRLTAFLGLGAVAVLGAGLVWLGWALTRPGARGGPPGRGRAAARGTAASLVPAGLFVMALGAASVIMVAVANLGGAAPRSASAGAGGLAALFAGPVVLAVLAGYALRRPRCGCPSGTAKRSWSRWTTRRPGPRCSMTSSTRGPDRGVIRRGAWPRWNLIDGVTCCVTWPRG
jgi:hypothetical protein